MEVRLPPQSPSRYIRPHRQPRHAPGPVAPAVSKSLHSRIAPSSSTAASGCPRSLQVATFSQAQWEQAADVRLPPQSPSRYIPGGGGREARAGPVAPAVSKSLHSQGGITIRITQSGCPRSLQVATFAWWEDVYEFQVRLPPQSPSRYIRKRWQRYRPSGPVAPAVSKSLHSRSSRSWIKGRSGCPRSLQVATFTGTWRDMQGRVRLPPQSPSRYIQGAARRHPDRSPVAPAVSKSLHSAAGRRFPESKSGCPRSLQVATFKPNGTLCSA